MLVDAFRTWREIGTIHLLNSVIKTSSLFLLPLTVLHGPTDIQIEPTSRCNMSCFMCGRPYLNRRNGDLSTDGLLEILDLFPHLRFVTMQGLGEPLLHPDFGDLLGVCSSHSVRVRFSTNGMVLDEEMARTMIREGVHQISFSIDALDPEIYSQIRRGGRIDLVLSNIRRLSELKSELGSDLPNMEIDLVAMRSNLHEIPKVARTASELGIQRVNVRQMYCMHASRLEEGDPRAVLLERVHKESLAREDEAVISGVFRKASREAMATGVEIRFPTGGGGGRFLCPWPWIHTYIDYEGYVTPCCVCPDKDEVCFGNVFEDGFRRIWNGKDYRELRRRLRSGDPPRYCQGCVRTVNEGLRAASV